MDNRQIQDAYDHQARLAIQQGETARLTLEAQAFGAEASAQAMALEAANAARQRTVEASEYQISTPNAVYDPYSGSRIAANPSQVYLDALAGLPAKSKGAGDENHH